MYNDRGRLLKCSLVQGSHSLAGVPLILGNFPRFPPTDDLPAC